MPKTMPAETTCHFCKAAPVGFRLPMNPPFGLDGNGRPRTQFELDLSTDPRAVRACAVHIEVRLVDGRPAPVAPRTAHVRAKSWTQRRSALRAELRTELIELLSGECKQCRTNDRSVLCVSVRPGLWSDLGIGDKTKRLEWLHRHPDHALVLCVDHIVTYNARTPSTVSHRDRVHAAYGGCCRACGGTERLYVVPDRSTPVLRWPGGRKYNSVQKCAYLVRSGFPTGWGLVCPAHLNRSK